MKKSATAKPSTQAPVKIVLASQSSARKRLLKRLGHRFLARPAHIDERSFENRIKKPEKLVQVLAEEKAKAVAGLYPEAVVIGSDQMLVLGRKVFGKPGTPQRAAEQLRAVSGKSIRLLTAVCVKGPRGQTSFVHETKMRFRNLDDAEIQAYVGLDQPLDCAGSFKFESFGIGLFASVTTDDPTAIEGLPLLHLMQALNAQGVTSPNYSRNEY